MNWYFASGDLGFFWKEQIEVFSWLPQLFDQSYGFGFSHLFSLWLDYPFRLLLKLLYSVGLSWFIIEKLLWISVFTLAMYSSKKLTEYILGKNVFTWAAPVVYAANTYMLLLFGGGQLGVAWAYSFSPFVLLRFIQFIDQRLRIKDGIVNGLFFALLVMFDLRLAYLLSGAVALYYGLMIVDQRLRRVSIVYHLSLIFNLFVIPLIVAGLVHAFWILPVLRVGGGTAGLGEELTSPGMLKFLSVADFSHALSLLHPNWPENLFGKVYFLQPEFLIIPLLAFAALTALAWKGQEAINNKQEEGQETISNKQAEGQEAISNKQQTRLLFTVYCPFFALLALVGAFFAKGVNEPFGGIYAWMFTHVPGFVMFRDPTKFYLYIAIGYSVLIPFTLQRGAVLIKDQGLKIKDKTNSLPSLIINHLSFIVFILFWLFTLRAVFTGEVKGNFRPTQLLPEYVQLKDLLVADTIPSRTLWIPQKENYAYFSDMHPILATDSAFVKDPLFIQKISQMGVRYVIVPSDVYKRLFLTDYRFDPSARTGLIDKLQQTSLKQNASFGDIAVFENDRFVFEQITPAVVAKQQQLANTGTLVSVIAIVLFLGYLLWERWTVNSKQ